MAKSFSARMNARFARITSNVQKQNDYIHETGMMLIRHAHEHGDCDLAAAFVRSLPASMRREMLVQWMAKYTPIRVKLGKNPADDKCGLLASYKALKSDDPKKAEAWNIDGADAEPFYALAESIPEVKEFDLAALIKLATNLGDRIEAMANNENEKAIVKADDRAKALEFAAKVKSLAAAA